MKLENLEKRIKLRQQICFYIFCFSALANLTAKASEVVSQEIKTEISTSEPKAELAPKDPIQPEAIKFDLGQFCFESLKKFPGNFDETALKTACEKVLHFEECTSVKGEKIFHYEKKGTIDKAKKILVFSLIHGDETPAGSVGRFWLNRLDTIDPRNHWRVVPVLNPDGVKEKTRYNFNKVDLNRNFPTKDWDDLAQKYWKLHAQSNPRRFPGDVSASEPELKCALKHIDDFKPDFIISIHTPLSVLDFDGPKVKPPKFSYLPWRSLGHFPGSLGRYMWFERKTPVLTMELKDTLPSSAKTFEDLQDIIGTLVKYEM
jgi:hypothetical protein